VAPSLPRSEIGLMGLAVSPDFNEDALIYVSYTTPDGPGFRNVVARFRLGAQGFEPADAKPLIDNLPAAYVHDGLPLRFGPDGMLYASTGEATQAQRAQDVTYLGGKFLRFKADGTIPADNPFSGSPVWSLGHRNPQGFAFHPTRPDLLLATEHGSSFPLDGTGGEDELNRVLPGRNYGWPLYRRDDTAPGFEPPLWHSGNEPIAPAGAAFCTTDRFPAWRDAFLFVGLRGASLWVVRLTTDATDQVASIERGLQDELGRLRALTEGPDGNLYVATSNRDGRGTPGPEDDRILRLVPLE
jgi:glucose/arabinose dehydrogenase